MNIDRTRASRKAARRCNVSPVARAIRSVLTLSTAALMFSGSGLALAQTPVFAPLPSARAALSHDFAKVTDLTTIHDAWIPKSVVDDTFPSLAAPLFAFAPADTAIEALGPVDDPTILPGTFHPGPGGVSGSDDYIGVNAANWPNPVGYASGNVVGTSTDGFADGFFVSTTGDLTTHNNATVDVTGKTWAAGFEMEIGGDAIFNNNQVLHATATGAGGIAIGVYQVADGDSTITNNSAIKADGDFSVGAWAKSINGDATVDNTATHTINANAYHQAIGILATGVSANVHNDGDVSAYGALEAIGIAGEGSATSSLYNAALVSATASGTEGRAIGLQADGLDASAINAGTIDVRGAFATGIDVHADGDAFAGNGHDVFARGGDVVGVSAISDAADYGNAEAANYGVIDASGDLFAVGMQSIAQGFHGNASALNVGGVYASAEYGSAQGVVVLADIAASVDNFGTIDTRGGSSAYGVLALTADGDIDVTNGYTIATYAGQASRRGDEIAYGIATQSNNGHITIANEGDVITVGQATAMGVYAATKWNDVDITNDGVLESIAYNGGATGAIAITYTGAANVSNGEDGQVRVGGAYSAAGLRSISLYGDTNVVNDGDITTFAGVLDRGITSRALYGGTASITNNGSISTDSGLSSYGAWARADFGDAVVDNTGSIQSYSSAYLAYGVVSGGRYHASVDNAASGAIIAEAGDTAAGILAYSNAGGVDVTNAGYVLGVGNVAGYGVMAQAFGTANVGNADGGIIAADGIDTAEGVFVVGDVVNFDNEGEIHASAGGWAAGVDGVGGTVNLLSHTGAEITAFSDDTYAFGMIANAAGNASVRNGGTLDVGSIYGNAYGSYAIAGGNAVLTNGGDLSAHSTFGNAFGMTGNGYNADLSNSWQVKANGYGAAVGMAGFGDAHAIIINNGDVNANATDGFAFGLFTSAVHDVRQVSNDSVGAHVDNGLAIGMYANGSGRAQMTNRGAVSATADAGVAYGVQVFGDTVDVTNEGTIDARATVYAAGLHASGTTVSMVSHTGARIDAFADDGATGMFGGADGNATVRNGAALDAGALGGDAFGTLAIAGGNAVLTNGGRLFAHSLDGNAFGMTGVGYNADLSNSSRVTANGHGAAVGMQGFGDAHSIIINNGDVRANAIDGFAIGLRTQAVHDVRQVSNDAVAAHVVDGLAIGMYANGGGRAQMTNRGAVSAIAETGDAYGIHVFGNTVDVTNEGSVDAHATEYAAGLYGVGATVSMVSNTGARITTFADHGATGMFGGADDDATVRNGGALDVGALDGDAFGTLAIAGGNAVLTNGGDLVAHSIDGDAFGLTGVGYNADLSNSSHVRASGNGAAVGLQGFGDAHAIIINNGDVHADAIDGIAFGLYTRADHDVRQVSNTLVEAHVDNGLAIGMYAIGGGRAQLTNRGVVDATADEGAAYGMLAIGDDVSVDNTGDIAVDGFLGAVGVRGIADGDITLTNSGSIAAGVALALDAGHAATITNAGDIEGALLLGAGNDRFTNDTNGTWIVRGNATDFGGGNDAIDNAGRIFLHDASIDLGSGTGNLFANTGALSVLGDSFVRNVATFTNNGTISFLDGAPDDTLTIAGDFAGDGNLNVDVSLLHGRSDMLYIDGSIASASVTKLNVNVLDLLPRAADVDIPVIVVQGKSSDANVQLANIDVGQVGFSANNFLNMHVSVKQRLTSNASVDMFSLTMGLDGLNDTGSLAAGIAPGAHSLMASQVGTFRQRMGQFTQLGDSDKGAWVRVFGDKGSINPEAQFSNLPSAGNYAFDQTNQGIEAGFNVLVTDGVYIGALLGTSKGKQDLDAGLGRDDLDGTTVGASLTWLGTSGMYADVTYRWMHFDADMTSLAGPHKTAGDVGALNIEAGWNVFTSEGGLKLVPQAQYTRSKVENIDRIDGDLANFVSNGGTSSRGRIGLELQQTIKSSDNTWTPYGVLSIVREFDGESRFVVADAFAGRTSTEGTSGLLELGVNARIGQRVDVWGGLNYMDGGAIDGVWGGQLGLRYTW